MRRQRKLPLLLLAVVCCLCPQVMVPAEEAGPCTVLSPTVGRAHFASCIGNTTLLSCSPRCRARVLGCTNFRKTNYNPLANVDDGTCDYNPCTDSGAHPCAEHATCGHTGPNAYLCTCNAGYVGNGSECRQPILACTYPTAENYNMLCSLATNLCVEDGSCVFTIAGCTDPMADNHNPAAGTDDGSCYVYGCTAPRADNYNPSATTDCVAWAQNGTCTARYDSCVVSGCSKLGADNYNPMVTNDDGSCIYRRPGCTYNNSINYNSSANVDDGSCIMRVLGCTKPMSPSYSAAANVDDGSCSWIPCDAEENSCHVNATCHHMGVQMHSCDCNQGFVGNGTACDVAVPGCLQPGAFNFNPLANVAAECVPIVLGCVSNSEALNFNQVANVDDGSCIPRVCGCVEPSALNYDPGANTAANASCEYDLCTQQPRCQPNADCTYNRHMQNARAWRWNASLSECDQAPAVNLCAQLGQELQQCPDSQTIANGQSPNNFSCTPSCDFQPACEQLGVGNDLIACGEGSLRSCVPRSLCSEGTFFCRCRDDYLSNGHLCYARQHGCTNAGMFNYNATANVDDGSCISIVEGCVNSMAVNFDPMANTDDGSCVVHPCNSTTHGCSTFSTCAITNLTAMQHSCQCFDGYRGNGTYCVSIPGCTYSHAMNFDAHATIDDGTCAFYIYGCTNASATNFAAGANTDDGTCVHIVRGCTYSAAWNFDVAANIDDGSCIMTPIFGCMNPVMANYNPAANVNSTCVPVVFGCMAAGAYNYDGSANTDDGSCNFDACTAGSHSCHSYALCNTTGPLMWSCTCIDGYVGNGTYCEAIVHGCTDMDAFNFNLLSNVDDGTCVAKRFGCIDPVMWNFDPTANTNPPIGHQAACVPNVSGCISETALNFEPVRSFYS